MATAGPSRSAQKTKPDTVSSSFSKNSEVIETYIIIPPDGGWGWVVAVTSFICNFTADGTMYTFGIFLDDISASIGSRPIDVALANSLMTGFYYLSGPVISALTNRFGYRAVSIIGGIISCVSILLTSYSSTLYALLFIYGVVGGIGFGMLYVPSIVVIGFYFERWRAIATSIAVCGSSLGIIAFPLVFKGLLSDTDWRVKFRILAILCLICAFFSILYRPLQPVRIITTLDKQTSMIKSSGAGSSEEETGMLSRYHNRAYPTAADLHGLSTAPLSGTYRTSSVSIYVGTTVPTTTTKSFVKSKASGTAKSKSSITQLRTIYEDEEDTEEYIKNKFSRCCTRCKKLFCCIHGKRNRLPTRPLYRDDIFYSGSLAILPEYIPSVHSAFEKGVEYHLSVTRVTTAKDLEQEDAGWICCPISVKRILATMLDMSLLKSPSFLLLSVSGLFTTLGLYTPFLFIADRAIQNGLEAHEAYYLISTLGISNTVGRILCGIFSSLPNINALLCSYVSLTICGLATLGSSLSYETVWQYGFASIYGSTIACVAALRPVIIAEMLGIEKLTNGFGLCLLFQGIACLVGLPFSSLLTRLTGSYEMSFYFAGSVILLSAILLLPMNSVIKWERNR